MSDNSNGKVARGTLYVLVALVLALMSGTAWNVLANADTNQRVARLEAQYDYVIKSLDRIEKALIPNQRKD